MTFDLDQDWGFFHPRGQDAGIGIGPVWDRKSIALYVHSPGQSRVLAYFRTEAAAREAMGWLSTLAAATGGLTDA